MQKQQKENKQTEKKMQAVPTNNIKDIGKKYPLGIVHIT